MKSSAGGGVGATEVEPKNVSTICKKGPTANVPFITVNSTTFQVNCLIQEEDSFMKQLQTSLGASKIFCTPILLKPTRRTSRLSHVEQIMSPQEPKGHELQDDDFDEDNIDPSELMDYREITIYSDDEEPIQQAILSHSLRPSEDAFDESAVPVTPDSPTVPVKADKPPTQKTTPNSAAVIPAPAVVPTHAVTPVETVLPLSPAPLPPVESPVQYTAPVSVPSPPTSSKAASSDGDSSDEFPETENEADEDFYLQSSAYESSSDTDNSARQAFKKKRSADLRFSCEDETQKTKAYRRRKTSPTSEAASAKPSLSKSIPTDDVRRSRRRILKTSKRMVLCPYDDKPREFKGSSLPAGASIYCKESCIEGHVKPVLDYLRKKADETITITVLNEFTRQEEEVPKSKLRGFIKNNQSYRVIKPMEAFKKTEDAPDMLNRPSTAVSTSRAKSSSPGLLVKKSPERPPSVLITRASKKQFRRRLFYSSSEEEDDSDDNPKPPKNRTRQLNSTQRSSDKPPRKTQKLTRTISESFANTGDMSPVKLPPEASASSMSSPNKRAAPTRSVASEPASKRSGRYATPCYPPNNKKVWNKELGGNKKIVQSNKPDALSLKDTGRLVSTEVQMRQKALNLLREALMKRLPELPEEKQPSVRDQLDNMCYSIETETWNVWKNQHDQKKKTIGYLNHFRSLANNLKDANNDDFYRRVLLGELSPESIATMKPPEMASDALQKEREKHAHALILAYENEAKQNAVYGLRGILKTHKGEREVETGAGVDAEEAIPDEYGVKAVLVPDPKTICSATVKHVTVSDFHSVSTPAQCNTGTFTGYNSPPSHEVPPEDEQVDPINVPISPILHVEQNNSPNCRQLTDSRNVSSSIRPAPARKYPVLPKEKTLLMNVMKSSSILPSLVVVFQSDSSAASSPWQMDGHYPTQQIERKQQPSCWIDAKTFELYRNGHPEPERAVWKGHLVNGHRDSGSMYKKCFKVTAYPLSGDFEVVDFFNDEIIKQSGLYMSKRFPIAELSKQLDNLHPLAFAVVRLKPENSKEAHWYNELYNYLIAKQRVGVCDTTRQNVHAVYIYALPGMAEPPNELVNVVGTDLPFANNRPNMLLAFLRLERSKQTHPIMPRSPFYTPVSPAFTSPKENNFASSSNHAFSQGSPAHSRTVSTFHHARPTNRSEAFRNSSSLSMQKLIVERINSGATKRPHDSHSFAEPKMPRTDMSAQSHMSPSILHPGALPRPPYMSGSSASRPLSPQPTISTAAPPPSKCILDILMEDDSEDDNLKDDQRIEPLNAQFHQLPQSPFQANASSAYGSVLPDSRLAAQMDIGQLPRSVQSPSEISHNYQPNPESELNRHHQQRLFQQQLFASHHPPQVHYPQQQTQQPAPIRDPRIVRMLENQRAPPQEHEKIIFIPHVPTHD